MKLLRIVGGLAAALFLLGADGDAVGIMRWEPFLSPALIVTIGIFVWREVHAMRLSEAEQANKIAVAMDGAVGRLDAIEQLLNGFNNRDGMLQSISNLKRAIADAQLWMTRVGDHLNIKYERRQSDR